MMEAIVKRSSQRVSELQKVWQLTGSDGTCTGRIPVGIRSRCRDQTGHLVRSSSIPIWTSREPLLCTQEKGKWSQHKGQIAHLVVRGKGVMANGYDHRIQALVFLISRGWVRVPVVTLLSLIRTLNHDGFLKYGRQYFLLYQPSF